jgi:hypothetical protein
MKDKKKKDLLPECENCGCQRYNPCSCRKSDKKSGSYKRKVNKENHKNNLKRS